MTMTSTPAGWYPHPNHAPVTMRWFDGAAWTDHVTPLPRPVLAPAPVVVQQQPRKYVTRGVSGGEHMLHVFMCLVTLGAWLPVYLLRMLAGRHRIVAKN